MEQVTASLILGTTVPTTSWEEVASVRPNDFLNRYARRKRITRTESERYFVETLRFLWVCAQRDGTSAPSAPIDECWHEFVLHTSLYAQFCQRHFNRFIHHSPSDRRETKKYAATRAFAEDVFGELDPQFWPQPTHAADCDSGTCRDYCSDNECSDGHE